MLHFIRYDLDAQLDLNQNIPKIYFNIKCHISSDKTRKGGWVIPILDKWIFNAVVVQLQLPQCSSAIAMQLNWRSISALAKRVIEQRKVVAM